MKKYIDAEVLKRKLIDEKGFFPAIVSRVLEEMPASNVAEVVRCKDCRMFVDNKEAKVTYCTRECKNITVNEDDFCSYGERKNKIGIL